MVTSAHAPWILRCAWGWGFILWFAVFCDGGAWALKQPGTADTGIAAQGGLLLRPMPYTLPRGLDMQRRAEIEKAMRIWQLSVGQQLFIYVGERSGVSSGRGDGTSMRDFWKKGCVSFFIASMRSGRGEWRDLLSTPYGKALNGTVKANGVESVVGSVIFLLPTLLGAALFNVALHELGHVLGLAHIAAGRDEESVMHHQFHQMDLYVRRHPSLGDIQRVQRIYGCWGSACDTTQLHRCFEQNCFAEEI